MNPDRGPGWLLACVPGSSVDAFWVGCTPGLTTNTSINQRTTGTKPLHEPMLTTLLGAPMWRIKNDWQRMQQRAPFAFGLGV